MSPEEEEGLAEAFNRVREACEDTMEAIDRFMEATRRWASEDEAAFVRGLREMKP